jgi:hypothetical protein
MHRPCNRPWKPICSWDVESPTFSRKMSHRWRWGCQPYAPAALYPPGIFLVLISVRGWADSRVIVRLEGLRLNEKLTSCEAASPAGTQELTKILGNPQVHYRVRKVFHSWSRSIRSMPPHPVSERSILILLWRGQPLLCNRWTKKSVMQPVSRQWIAKHVPAAMNRHTIALLLETGRSEESSWRQLRRPS